MEIFNKSFMPHGHCYFWRPDILWLHAISDSMIALAYFMIPVILIIFIKKRKDIPHKWLFGLFGIFILSCGITHIIGIFTIWNPVYVLEGWSKAWTGLISMATAVALVPIIPKVLALRSPKELELINKRLEVEIETRKKAELELQKVIKELEQYAYTASHDLQEPLRKIKSFTELLSMKYKGNLDEKADQYIDYIVDGSTRMQALIKDLLEYSRVGRQNKDVHDVNINDVVIRVISSLEVLIRENNGEARYNQLPKIRANENDMQRIFLNLISNSIKFKKPDTNPIVTISSEDKDEEHVFSVSDNGIGIEKDCQDKVFGIFERLHTNKDYKGTGIGLAVCKKIIEKYGGRIWIESEKNVGTTFFFSIPKVVDFNKNSF